MKLPLQLLIILTILFTSCEKKNESLFILNNEGEMKQLSFSPKQLDGSNIGPIDKYGLIDDIYFIGNNLFMYDVKSDSIFLIYNLKGKLKKYFTHGEGPNQFFSPQSLKISNISNIVSDVKIFEFGKGLYQLNLKNNQKTPLFSVKNYGSTSAIQSVTMMENEKFALVDTDQKTILSIFDLKTKKTTEIPHIINEEIINPDQYYSGITPPDIGFNEEHKILFTWTGVFNTIDLYDSNGDFIKSYRYGTNLNIEDNKFKRKYFYYYNIKSHGDYIYGLYAGFNTLDNFTEALIPRLKSQLHIFNINTNEARIFQLDRLINACAVDFTNNVIYAIEEGNESQPLVKYEIN
jgi:hypothetical protein